MNKFIQAMQEWNEEAVRLTGLDDAIVGIAHVPCKGNVFVYDREKCIEVTMRDQKWDRDDAVEWLEHNTFCAHFGDYTPVFLEEVPDAEPS